MIPEKELPVRCIGGSFLVQNGGVRERKKKNQKKVK
jgi:hypothetical protein